MMSQGGAWGAYESKYLFSYCCPCCDTLIRVPQKSLNGWPKGRNWKTGERARKKWRWCAKHSINKVSPCYSISGDELKRLSQDSLNFLHIENVGCNKNWKFQFLQSLMLAGEGGSPFGLRGTVAVVWSWAYLMQWRVTERNFHSQYCFFGHFEPSVTIPRPVFLCCTRSVWEGWQHAP